MTVVNPSIAPVQNPMLSDLDVGAFELIGFNVNKGLVDSNGNEIFTLVEKPDAVNNVAVDNAAAGDPVIIRAVGDDLNIPLSIRGKGTGPVNISDAYDLPTSDSVALRYMRTDGAGVVSFTRGEPLIIPLFDPTAGTNYIETASTGYVNIAQFNYMGSSSIGTISSMSAGIWTSDAGFAASIKIIDETNTNDISEITGIVSTSTVNQAGFAVISDVPAGSAVFSVNILIANATRRARISWLRLSFS